MKDTIHLGWLGWLAFDKAVDPFLSNPTPAPTYHLNERFFSKDWATYDGDIKEFQQIIIWKSSRMKLVFTFFLDSFFGCDIINQ